MRKVCFLLFTLVIFGTSWGQVSSEINRSRIPSPALFKDKPGTVDQSQAKMSLWSSDFSNMSQWIIGNSAGNTADWSISNAPYFWWSNNSALASSSGGYAASFNSDAYATGDNQIENNAWIQTAVPVNCFGHNGIELTFEQFYSKWTSKTIVEVSSDGGQSWTDFEVNSSMIENEETNNPSLVTVNISSAAGNQSDVLIRLLFLSNATSQGGTDNTAGVAWDYGWIVDDFNVRTLPDDDIALLEAWHADLSSGYEYSVVPLDQVREMVPTLIVQNQGSLHQNADFECVISGGSGVISTLVINHTVMFGSTDTLYFHTGFTPTAIDEYEISFSIPTDDDPSNDSIEALPLYVSDFVMAHNYGSPNTYGWDPQSADPVIVAMASGAHSWGNVFEMEADQTIYSVGVDFATGTADWLNVKVRVQQLETGGTIQGPLTLINETYHTIPPSEIGNEIINISFTSPSLLLGGKTYIVDVIKVDTGTVNQALFIGGSSIGSEDDDFSTVAFGPYGGSGVNVNYFSNWSFAPAVRANFNQELSLMEQANSEFLIFPNPSTGIVNISDGNSGEKSVQVLDLFGKIIFTGKMTSQLSIDLSAFKAGIYFISVSDNSTSSVKRIVLQ
ncbi:MAG: T9SS type A sorting domain-containing protein [Crocinitomicaceae bacterium]|nr:T9SS type A sorting domain-containing protein [Crocinitomicaceae bacterium]